MTFFFYDVNDYLGNWVAPPETRFLMARATLSDSVRDTTFERHRARAAQIGSKFAGYHWLNHGNVTAQVVFAHKVLGLVPLMVDAEDMPGNTGYAGPVSVADIAAFVDGYRGIGGVCNVIYLPEWYWRDRMGSPDLGPLVRRGLVLCSSNYTRYADDGIGWRSYGGMTPTIWQFTSTPIDTNAFRGTVEELWAVVSGETVRSDGMVVYQCGGSYIAVDGGQVISRVWDGPGGINDWIASGFTPVQVSQGCLMALTRLPDAGSSPVNVSANELADAILAKVAARLTNGA